jgi:hypothetical protein
MARSKGGKHPGADGSEPEKQRPAKDASVSLQIVPPGRVKRYAVLAPDSGFTGPLIVGSGGPGAVDFVCGACGYLLVEKRAPGEPAMLNVAIQCPGCETVNDATPINF